jgi:hypothetical protein
VQFNHRLDDGEFTPWSGARVSTTVWQMRHWLARLEWNNSNCAATEDLRGDLIAAYYSGNKAGG